jgi:hypothetical protein
MKKLSILSVFFIVFLFLLGCGKEKIPAPELKIVESIIANTPVDPMPIALELIKQSGWPMVYDAEIKGEEDVTQKKSSTEHLINFQRQMITDNIVHYKFQVSVGSDQHDIIGIHRVVMERSKSRPIETDKVIFLQHGDAKDFEGMFLPGIRSPNTPDDFGIAVYLAENNVDVWGIDQAWTLVPKETNDFSFMADWGIQKQVDDLRIGMAITRFARLLTGSGFDQLILSGYSSGVATGFALLNEETQRTPTLRHVKGYIPVDFSIKIDNETAIKFFKDYYTALKTRLDNGEYQDPVPFQTIGNLARTDPDGSSPIMPGMTNLQTALFFGAGKIVGVIPFHYIAGVWENEMPVDLQFVTKNQWFDFLESGVPYEALRFMVEYSAMTSDVVDVPFDDHFSEIEVPLFNIAPAGGFGDLSIYGTTLLGSSDITHRIIKHRPPEEIVSDYGHIDVFIANNAEIEVWQPILRWIESHTNDTPSL